MTTNFEKWRHYMDWCISPDAYIDWGYYSLVAAFLQRRVWSGPSQSPLFPNMYVVPVGEPGVGKGLVVKEYTKILKHFHLKPPAERKSIDGLDPNIKTAMDVAQNEEYKELQKDEDEIAKKSKWFEAPLLLPVAADDTTYEALCRTLAKSKRLINFPDKYPDGRPKLGIYTHSSLSFSLEEMSSLFKKESDKVIKMLLKTYDCGDYDYETKHQGKDRIRNCCLNIFAGTTPGFMDDCLNDKIINEGFSSRTFFVYAAQNRKATMRFAELTPEQIECKKQLLEHLEKLTHLYGAVKYTEEAWEFLENWWQKAQSSRPNINTKLNYYYSRKNIHVQKLAMALHFGESLDFTIGVETFVRALEILARTEKHMHFCLGFDKGNPLASCTRKIEKFILASKNGGYNYKELLAEFYDTFPSRDYQADLTAVIEHLMFAGTITSEPKANRAGETVLYYKPKIQSE